MVSCAAPRTVPRAAPSLDREAWLARVETASRARLEDLCLEIPPEGTELAPAEDRAVCASRVTSAIQAEWERITADALRVCVAEQGARGCCFSRRKVSAEGQRRRLACDKRCSSAVGHPVEADEGCASMTTNYPLTETAAVADLVEGCDGTAAVAQVKKRCESLPSPGEREYCKVECELRVERAQVEEAVTDCVQRARAGGDVYCVAPAVGYHNYDRDYCERKCVALVRFDEGPGRAKGR